ncbi:MAG: GNAT family N-acetyltransferase [Lachnospiraceae bacterium]|nr:GNAT family N-acetyltransferase [Lachnospiraceae bacterium]
MDRIYGKNVYIRPITEEDTDLIITWRNSDAVRPYFIYQKPFTKEGHEKWLETMIRSGLGYQFIVCRKEDDEPIGCTYLRDYDRENSKIEYGVFLGLEDVKGKGIGTEILGLTLQFAFDKLNIHKVFARAFADNPASIGSFLKGGFEKEAYLRDEVYVNGEYRDIVLLGKINPGHIDK